MQPDFWLEERVRVVSSDLKYTKSVDGFLVKLSTLLYDISDECMDNASCTRSYFEKALKHPLLKRELSRLSCYLDTVEKLVVTDPRFKALRAYLDVLVGVLKELECTGLELEVSREATFRLEERPTIPGEKPPIPGRRLEWTRIAAWVAVAIAILLIAVAILRLLVR